MINSQLKSGDTLVCLGDLGRVWQPIITKINNCAKKILIMGNHDNLSKNIYLKYFDEVYSGPIFATKFVILSHEPIPVSDHFLNLHGHLHNAKLDDFHHINLGYKCNNYKLYNLNAAQKLTSNYPRIKAHFLEEWYADKYIFIDKDERRNCFFYRNSGHIVPKEDVELYFKIAKSELILRQFNRNQKRADELKKIFDEYFILPENRSTILYDDIDKIKRQYDCSRRILNSFIEGMNLQNELAILPDYIYGRYYFFTDFSGRCIDKKGALVKLKAIASYTYEPEEVIIPDYGIKNTLVKFLFNEGKVQVDENIFSTAVNFLPHNFNINGEMKVVKTNMVSKQFQFISKIFISPNDDAAKLQYELNIGEGPYDE